MTLRPLLISTLLSGAVLCPGTLFSQWMQTNGPFGGRVFSFAQDGDTVYAASEGGLYLSTDEGGFWSRIDFGGEEVRAGHVAVHRNMVFVGTDIGVYRSDEEGTNWEYLNSAPDSVVTLLYSAGEYIFVAYNHSLFRSVDGTSWELSDDAAVQVMLATDEGIFSGVNGGLFFSSDSGFTWTRRDSGIANPTGTRVRTLATDNKFIYAGTVADTLLTVYRSDNDGMLWTKVSTLPLNGRQEKLYVFLSNYDNLFAGTTEGVFQSWDQGQTWLPVNNGLSNLEILDLVTFENVMLAGSGGGISKTTTNGFSWDDANSGLIGTRIRGLVMKGDKLFASSPVSGLFFSPDLGGQWYADESIPEKRILSLYAVGEYLFAGTNGKGIFISSDDGASWSTPAVGPSNGTIHSLAASGALTFAGTDTGVFVSSDLGVNWSFSGLASSTVLSMVSIGAFLWAGTDSNGLWATTNGSSWSDTLQAGLGDSSVFSLGVVGSVLYAGTGSAGIFRSTNNGKEWVPVNSGLPDTLSSVTSILPIGQGANNLLAATAEDGVFRSSDGGDTWTEWNEGLEIFNLNTLVAVDSTVFCGTSGSGVVSRHFPPAGTQLATPEDGSVSPGGVVSLSWLPSPGAVSYDVQVGLTSGFTTPVLNETGIPTASLNAEPLASNTRYYWRVRAVGEGGPGPYSTTWEFSTAESLAFASAPVATFPEQPVASTDYRLVGFPGASALTPGMLLNGSQGAEWKMFADNGAAPPDHLTELSAGSPLSEGEGYWLVTRGELLFSQTVLMPKPDSVGTCAIPVDTGWNIITNPFERPVTVSSIRFVNDDAAAAFKSYEGTTGFKEDSVLNPFRGYYYYNPPDDSVRHDSLIIPYPFPASELPSMTDPAPLWNLRLVLETPAGTDGENYLGVLSSAERGNDRFDRRKPPFPGEQPFLAFVRSGGSGSSPLYETDFRPPQGEGETWYVQVSSPASSDATIRVVGAAGVPGDAGIVLLDEASGVQVDLRQVSTYGFHVGPGKRSFSILIGPEAFLNDGLSATIPSEFELSQNYPNPFNPTTTIRVGLPFSAEIQLDVFSVLGTKVTTLAKSFHEAGRFTFTWNGESPGGKPVASGMYFYRLTANGKQIAVRKMLLLR